MNTTTVTKTIEMIKSVKEEYIQSGIQIVGMYIVELKDWNISNFLPFIILTKNDLRIQIGEKYIDIVIKDIEKIELNNNNDNKSVIITHKNKELELSLVNIDENLDKPNSDFTQNFFVLISTLWKHKPLDPSILPSLPDQSNSTTTNKASMPIIISSIFLIALGMVVQTMNFVLAWLLVLVGFIMGIIGIILLALKRK